MKLIWITDIHLNFIDYKARQSFYQKMLAVTADTILITGDIAEANTVATVLQEMAAYIKKPIYFVLGNHDYYRGGLLQVSTTIVNLCQQHPWLTWLPQKIINLTHETTLIGVDAWADGRYGNYADSRLTLNDSRMIEELRTSNIIGKFKLLDTMQQLADTNAQQLEGTLQQAIKQHPQTIIILLHVPPFKENCPQCDDDYLPFFASKAIGDLLLKTATANPHLNFLVLCGHTHTSSNYQPLDNLRVQSGNARYAHPTIQDIIEIL